MGVDYQTAVKISAGFSGGMMLGSVCGAVTGGIMAIGVKHGGLDRAVQIKTAGIVRQFADRFKAKHGSINCPDLIGVDLGKIDLANPEAIAAAYQAAQKNKAFAKCSEFVKDAATIVTELLNS